MKVVEKTKSEAASAGSFGEPRDYYMDENGMLVMTEAFLKRRGFCCGNGCRHCPYEGDEKVSRVPQVPRGESRI